MFLEREKKYLLRAVPVNILIAGQKIIQHYLTILENGKVIRLRWQDGQCFQTVKDARQKHEQDIGVVSRIEYEYSIEQDFFDLLIEGSTCFIEKDRYWQGFKGWSAEIDIFTGKLAGLFMVEIMIDSDLGPDHFPESEELPLWMHLAGAVDVSDDYRFSNYNLAKMSSAELAKLLNEYN